MEFMPTEFDGVWLIEPRVWRDDRGALFENYSRRVFAEAGIGVDFVQDNHSISKYNALRGLHFQVPPHTQAKLVRTVVGEVYDVIVDLRRGAPTFGHWACYMLSAENRRMLFIPEGFAHGFCVTSATAEVLYKCSDFYAPDCARGIRWDDQRLAIPWPVDDPILSEKDRRLPTLADTPSFFEYSPAR